MVRPHCSCKLTSAGSPDSPEHGPVHAPAQGGGGDPVYSPTNQPQVLHTPTAKCTDKPCLMQSVRKLEPWLELGGCSVALDIGSGGGFGLEAMTRCAITAAYSCNPTMG